MADYAPGLPEKNERGEPQKVLKPGELYDYVLQHHSTLRNPKRPHFDLRIGSPETGLYSWAIPGAELPEPGKKKLAPQTEIHRHSYGSFQGRIGHGYGAGDVRLHDTGKALISKVTPNSVSFTLAHTKVPVRYSLIKIDTESGRDWLLVNKPIPGKVPGVGDKPKYQMIQAEDLDAAMAKAESVQEKIDGGHGIFDIGDTGKVEAYSVNPRVTGEPIPHTERLGLHGLEIPSLKGTTLRGEIYGSSRETGKAIPFNRLSGILNAGIAKSIERQRADKVRMQTGVFDVIRHKGKTPEFKTEAERQALLDEIIGQLPAEQFHKPQTAVTAKEKADLITDIRTGKNPRTQEGVVMRMPNGNIAKFKLRPESTAYMTGIFPGEGKRKAVGGGFTYATEPGGKTVGNVGTGFTDEELREVARNVKEYMGKPMRLTSMGQFESGKHRAPSFGGWETDKAASASARAQAKIKEVLMKIKQSTDPDFPKGNIRYDLMDDDDKKSMGHAVTIIPHVHPEKATFLREVYVAPEQRGKGLVKTLIEHVKAQHPNKAVVLRPLPFEYIPGTNEETTDPAAVGGRTKADLIAMYKHLGFEHHPTKKDRMLLRPEMPEMPEKKAAIEIPRHYLDMYNTFDAGHGPAHRDAVRANAVELASKYAPKHVDTADAAAALHDVGLGVGREGHEIFGYDMVRKDPELQQLFGGKRLSLIAQAIKQHRASTGQPRHIVSKIVSDADRVGSEGGPGAQLLRAVEYGRKKFPEMTDEEQIWRAAQHQAEKYGPGGYGTRAYFPETARRISSTVEDIIKAVKAKDVGALRALLQAVKKAEKTAEATLITGFIGGGKSTEAKRLAKAEGAQYVSVDVLRSNNRKMKLTEFMKMLNALVLKDIQAKEKFVIEGIHVAKLDPQVIAQAQRVIKTETPEGTATLRAIIRNLKRAKDPEKKIYGWPALKVVKDIIENRDRFRGDIVAFPKTKDVSNKKTAADKKPEPQYAVDLDGTLAKYTGWKGHEHIGEPVSKMVKRVKHMLDVNKKVVIFTARASDPKAIEPIKAWCKKHLGRRLPVTNVKNHAMVKFIDDRAEGIVKNTGEKRGQAGTGTGNGNGNGTGTVAPQTNKDFEVNELNTDLPAVRNMTMTLPVYGRAGAVTNLVHQLVSQTPAPARWALKGLSKVMNKPSLDIVGVDQGLSKAYPKLTPAKQRYYDNIASGVTNNMPQEFPVGKLNDVWGKLPSEITMNWTQNNLVKNPDAVAQYINKLPSKPAASTASPKINVAGGKVRVATNSQGVR